MTFLDILITWALVKLADRMWAGQTPPTTTRTPHVPPPKTPDRSRRPAPVTTLPATFTPPWPQVVPEGLPPFPGSGWEPDEPPSPDVVSRAHMLLSSLWKGGPGTFKVEKTAGRWIAYRATPMGTKRGVVAYRESRHAPFLTPPTSAPRSEPSGPVQTASVRPPSAATSLPTLRQGSRGNDVVILQKALGIPADGAFGPQTERAVRAFQSSRGLKVDGIVGPQTWGALLGKAA